MSFLTIVCFVWKKNSSSCSFLFSICLIDLSPFLYFEPMGVIVCKIDIFNSTYSWVLKKWTFSPFSFNTVSIFFFLKKRTSLTPNLSLLSSQISFPSLSNLFEKLLWIVELHFQPPVTLQFVISVSWDSLLKLLLAIQQIVYFS